MTNKKFNINHLIQDEHISHRILYFLSERDLNNCALVNKTWRYAVYESRQKRTLRVTVDLIKTLKKKETSLRQYIKKNYPYATDLDVIGWSSRTQLSTEIYEQLLRKGKLKARCLVLRGRGVWDVCYCPKDSGVTGQLSGLDIKRKEKTNFEYIHIGATFQVSACALLDLIARSPNLKTLRFNGILRDHEHSENFQAKFFSSNLDTLYWPIPVRKHMNTIKVIVKRNENITCLYTTGEVACDLLSCDILPNLKHLSLFLNENWACKPNKTKKAFKFLENTKYLALAKKLVALELRTFNKEEFPEVDDNNAILPDAEAIKETNSKVDKIYEQYKTDFWSSIGKLKNLTYLCVYGSWELDEVCREISRNLLPIEYLKISLMPASVINSIDQGNDDFLFSMTDGFKCLKRLVNLRSIQYHCYERLIDVDQKTILAWKDMYDKIWSMDIKVGFTPNIEDFLIGLNRRGNQLGKSYQVMVNVTPKDDRICSFVFTKNMKTLGTSMKDKLTDYAEKASMRRSKDLCKNIYMWGYKQIENSRDAHNFKKLKSDWDFYENRFEQSFRSI